MLVIYSSFQHVMMFEHNKSPALCLQITDKQQVKRTCVFPIRYMYIGYVGFDAPVATVERSKVCHCLGAGVVVKVTVTGFDEDT